jgi:hypothetical protein
MHFPAQVALLHFLTLPRLAAEDAEPGRKPLRDAADSGGLDRSTARRALWVLRIALASATLAKVELAEAGGLRRALRFCGARGALPADLAGDAIFAVALPAAARAEPGRAAVIDPEGIHRGAALLDDGRDDLAAQDGSLHDGAILGERRASSSWR